MPEAVHQHHDTKALLDFIAPVIEQAQAMEKPPHALLIEPGSDWPANIPKPDEKLALLLKPSKADIARLPKGTIDDIRREAESIVKDMGLPPDATIDDLLSGKLKPSAPAQAAPDSSPDKASAKTAPRMPAWKQKLAPVLMATAGIMAQGDALGSSPKPAQTPPAAVSSLEAIGSERRRSSNRREAYTLVEVLVVIGIVGTIAALMLPAVQKARDAAREIQYKNNMRQVGIALHNFEGAHGKFPNSVSYEADSKGVLVPHSWVVDILPYIEQEALANQYDKKKPHDQQTPEVQNAIIPTLQHPGYNSEPGRMHMAALSSSGTSATNPSDIASQNGIPKDYLLTQEPGVFNVGLPPEQVMGTNGRWQKIPATRMAGFTDGTSHTAIVAAHNHEDGNRDPWLMGPDGGKTRFTGLMFGTEIGQSRVNGGLMGNVSQQANFVTNHVISHGGLRHPENHKVLFADGSVRNVAPTGAPGASWLNESAERWRQMVNRSDGNNPSDDLSK